MSQSAWIVTFLTLERDKNMAFVSMIIVMLGILAFILIGIAILFIVAGIVLLIIGLVKRNIAIKNGKPYSLTCIVLGCVLILIPIITFGGAFVSSITSGIEKEIERSKYDNCVDEWKNEWVSSNEVKGDLIEEFFEAADNGDKRALLKLYSKRIQKNSNIVQQIEDFMEEYPGGFSELEFEYQSGVEDGSSDYGVSYEYLRARYEVKKGGDYYYISFGCCYESDEEPDEIGLDYMIINSEKAEVLQDELDYERSDDEHIIANIDVSEEFETRRVAGNPCRYINTGRLYTEEEVLDAIRESYDLYELTSNLGEPHGTRGGLNEIIYEIEPEDNEYRYIEITHTDDKKIVKGLTQIVGTEGGSILRFDEDLEPESTEK